MAALISAFLPLAMLVLMFTLGLQLRPSEMRQTLANRRAMAAGLGAQLIALPLLAFGLGSALSLSPAVFAGLMLVAASPGGVSSNYITHLARGSVALSVTMTLASTLAAPLSMPIALMLSGVAMPASGALARISLGMTAVAVVPLLAGMALRHVAPRMGSALGARIAPLAKAVFALMVLATFVQNWDAMQAAASEAGLSVALLALAAPLLGLGAGRALRLGPAIGRTIAIELSLQNVAVTIFVAGTVLGRPELALPGLIYALAMNLVALVLIWYGAERGTPAPASEPPAL